MMILELTYLNGWSCARAEQGEAEWPPHPARLFYALASCYFEAGEDARERALLEWLENQPPPIIYVRGGIVGRRELRPYVPTNDVGVRRQRGRNLESLPDLRTTKNVRTFSYALLKPDTRVYFVWEAAPDADRLKALDRLCMRLACLGHSSSFVRLVRLERLPEEWDECWQPGETGPPEAVLRVPRPGVLASLSDYHQRYQRSGIRGVLPAGRIRYGRVQRLPVSPADEGIRPGEWNDLLILRQVSGPTLPVLATAGITTQLHRALISRWQELYGEVPEAISGHTSDGSVSKAPHLAFLALPAVGHRHSDGHLMGCALALPRNLSDKDLTRLWELLEEGLELKLRPRPWRLEPLRYPSSMLPYSLQESRWVGPSRLWASVTPVVLDRYPRDRDIFGEEAKRIVTDSCEQVGFPRPVVVVLSPVSIFGGTPRATDFPLPRYCQRHVRVHALVEFDQKVWGPLLIGKGRYRGLGLFAPIPEGAS